MSSFALSTPAAFAALSVPSSDRDLCEQCVKLEPDGSNWVEFAYRFESAMEGQGLWQLVSGSSSPPVVMVPLPAPTTPATATPPVAVPATPAAATPIE